MAELVQHHVAATSDAQGAYKCNGTQQSGGGARDIACRHHPRMPTRTSIAARERFDKFQQDDVDVAGMCSQAIGKAAEWLYLLAGHSSHLPH